MNKKRLSFVLIVLVLVVVICVTVINFVSKKDDKVDDNKADNELNNKEMIEMNNKQAFEDEKDNYDIKGLENTEVIDKETAINKSNEIKEKKVVDDLEISDIKVEYKSSETRITGKILNKLDKDMDFDFLSMDIIGKDNKVMLTRDIYVGKIKANDVKNLDFTITANIVNLYDITFNK